MVNCRAWILFIENTLFALSIILFIVSGIKNEIYYSGSLLSIPLYPTSKDGICDYVGNDPNSSLYQSTEINFPLDRFNSLKKRQEIYLVHNLWGYNFDLSVLQADFESQNVHSEDYHNFQQNSGNNRSLDINISENFNTIDEILPRQFSYKKNCYFVYCPKSTPITRDLNIEPECKSSFGAVANLKNIEYWQFIKIGKIDFELKTSKLSFVFHNLTVAPMNYIEPPALFLATWKKTNSDVIFTFANIFLYLGILIFLCSYAFLRRNRQNAD